jgi:hypothetical protein
MQTFSDTDRERLREAFDALVIGVGPAPELDELVDRPLRVRAATPSRRRGLMGVVAVVGLLLGVGLTALLSSDQSPVASDSPRNGDVIVFFASNTPFDTLVEISDEVMTWEGVAVVSPWTSQDAYEEFTEAFADQPDLIAVVREDPSILPSSVRIWVEPGVDLSAIAQRAGEEFPDALDVSFVGEEQPEASDLPDSTLPPLEILVTQVEPIYGYGDYTGYSYAEVPWDRVTAAQIQCLKDQGWPVIPNTDTGISFRNVPPSEGQAAEVDFARCMAGLNLPAYEE